MYRFIIISLSITIYICSKSGGNALAEESNPQLCSGWGQMKCWSGQCVNITGKCNGVMDCADGSDEQSFFCKTMLCDKQEFQCGYGACIPKQAQCNGTKDCWDGTDELEELCKKEVYPTSPPTTKLNLTMVTESIVNPSINAINTNKSTEQRYISELERDTSKIGTPAPAVGTITPNTTILPPTKITTKRQYNPTKATTVIPPTKNTTNWQQTTTNQYNSIKATTILPPTKVTTKRQQTTTNQYNSTKTTTILPPTKFTTKWPQAVVKRYRTPHTTTTKPITVCVLRSCDQPLSCKISVPGSHDSEIPHKQGRLSLVEGSEVTFNCAEGYDLVGANRSACTPTDWSHNIPSCIPYCDADFVHNCTSPLNCLFEQPNSGSKFYITKEFTQSRVREQSRIRFTCDNDYLLEGPTMRNCTAKGWSNEMPRCVNHCDISKLEPLNSPLKCKVFDSNIRYFYDYKYNRWNKKIKEGSYFEYSCEDGYKLKGENQSTCMNNGWSSVAPTCIPLCDLSRVSPCKAPLFCHHNHKRPFLDFGSRADVVLPNSGMHVDYSCEDGYELEGAERITCTNDGWSNRVPTCNESTCDVSILTDCTFPLKCKLYDEATRTYKNIYRGDMSQLSNYKFLYVRCEDGYTLQGSPRLNCRGGKWDYNMPKCIEEISKTCYHEILDNCIYPMICERFDSEFNGFRKISFATEQKPLSEAEQIKFSCENGFTLDGRKYLTCTAGKWNYNMPKCIATRSCSGYLIPSCEHPLTCTIFDSKSKTEEIITDNNIIKFTNYTLNTQIIFGCANGYKLKGEEQTICRSYGWSHEQSLKLPQCTIASPCDPDIFRSCKEPLNCFYLSPNQETFLPVRSGYLITEVRENTLVVFRCYKRFQT